VGFRVDGLDLVRADRCDRYGGHSGSGFQGRFQGRF
jgi:hypothetical protein